MHDNNHADDGARHGASAKIVEAIVAVAILLLGLLVIVDSRRVGAGWADDGPQAGYFPFYIGVLLCLASAWTLVRALAAGKSGAGVFVSRKKFQLVLAVLIPSAVYVGAIYVIGIYSASAIFIGAFMYWHGRFRWTRIVPVSLSVPVAMFLLFEVWFLVPLPKGPLEALIGY